MKPETYWPQDKLYFYATCALFPDKLITVPLNSQKFKTYIPYYFDVDEQTEELEQLKRDGLLDFTVYRTDDSNAEYLITQINSDEFTSILKEYLKRYRNDELIGDTKYTFAANNDQLIKYLDSSTREEPVVNPVNIWVNWTAFSSHPFPFWEAVLTFQLIDAKGEIVDLGQSISNKNSYKEDARPFVNIKVSQKELRQNKHKQQPIKHKVSIVVTSRGKLQLYVSGKRTTIRTYKSEKNDTHRAARALYAAKGGFLNRNELNLNPDRKTSTKNLVSNMGFTGVLAELFIEYGDSNAVSLRHHAIADEDQFEKLLILVKALNQKSE